MRAIMQQNVIWNRTEPEQAYSVKALIDQVATHCQWNPRISDKAEIEKRQKEILDTVSEDDKLMVETTLLATIYDARTKTWGIVSAPNERTVEFRLKNPVSEKLKRACVHIIEDLSDYSKHSANGAKFNGIGRIEVLEPKSQHQAFIGEVISERPFILARSERRPSYLMAIIATTVSAVCIGATSPLLADLLKIGSDGGGHGDWGRWAYASLMHFTPAFLVTAAVSWLDLYLHWRGIKREAPIRWRVGVTDAEDVKLMI